MVATSVALFAEGTSFISCLRHWPSQLVMSESQLPDDGLSWLDEILDDVEGIL